MGKTEDISGYSDEELIRRFSVEIRGKRFIRAKVLEAIGKRRALEADRKPGDPGTPENPIFKDRRAYVYSETNQLIMWEDYTGEVPREDGLVFFINPETTETFTLKHDMKPTEEQRRMVLKAKQTPISYSEDCPKSSPERLERFRQFGKMRNMRNRQKET